LVNLSKEAKNKNSPLNSFRDRQDFRTLAKYLCVEFV
jgi:hypothetical protein